MAHFIDSFKNSSCEVHGGWFISKPITLSSLFGLNGLTSRIKDAWGVFTGKYTAVFFAEDDRDWILEMKQKAKRGEQVPLGIPTYTCARRYEELRKAKETLAPEYVKFQNEFQQEMKDYDESKNNK